MSANKGTGVNKVLIRLLKICVNEIVESLTYIMNQSFETGTFPNIWKIAHVRTIFKPGDKLELNPIIHKFQLN